MEPICETMITTPLGKFTVRCSKRGIREISFGAGRRTPNSGNGRPLKVGASVDSNGEGNRAGEWSRRAAQELEEYAAGGRKTFTVPLDLEGTSFQKKVWTALQAIPYGQTRSYGEIARRVGNPRAARAVGMANHENPIAIVVPCHRVIAGDGSLGGYAGGLRKKLSILNLEKSHAEVLQTTTLPLRISGG
jgi:methylated-DNA-[protein]-cysteine S-methyltransferase